MKIALIDNSSKELLEISRLLGDSSTVFKSVYEFEKVQASFDSVYCPKYDELLKIKVRVPYFYDISPKSLLDEMSYYSFAKHYSQLSGPRAVFVCDKKLNKSSKWLGLNTYWVNSSVDSDILPIKKKFLTPILDIGYIYENAEGFELLKKVIFTKKSNWVFHIYCPDEISSEIKNNETIFYSGDLNRVKKEIYSKTHIFLNYTILNNNMSECFPDINSLEAMTHGCALISSNPHGNNTSVFFDDLNYLKLDYIDANTILDALRYADKKRGKLESISKEGRLDSAKYFNYKDTAIQKVSVLLRYIK